MNNKQRGKDAERRLAKRLGGRRVGTMGEHDVEIHGFSVEVKLRKSFVGRGWMEQAKRNCQPGTDPCVIITLPYQRDPYIMMSLSTWEAWHGKTRREE